VLPNSTALANITDGFVCGEISTPGNFPIFRFSDFPVPFKKYSILFPKKIKLFYFFREDFFPKLIRHLFCRDGKSQLGGSG
jgi:hypothetical protein